MHQPKHVALIARLASAVMVSILVACGDRSIANPLHAAPDAHSEPLLALTCTASIARSSVSCESAPNAGGTTASRNIIGGQNTFVKMTSSNVSYDPCTALFEFDVTVQNLLNEALGSPDGVLADTSGVRVFFQDQPVATAGNGTITIPSPDGVGTFTASNQPYYKYNQILAHNATSSAKRWQLHVPATVTAFSFTVYVSATVQSMLVINEVMSNPGGTISDANGEWLEVYNAGTIGVDMQGYLLADSSALGIRPFNVISTSLFIPGGGYLVFGNTTNTTNNGGVPVDYAYGAGMALANSLDALKIARVFPTGPTTADTVTIDYVHYASAAVSAQNGISRELKNPALDNLNMDGSNWADAPVANVFGPGGRGTPKQQNAAFVP
jgi:hypothetical protein